VDVRSVRRNSGWARRTSTRRRCRPTIITAKSETAIFVLSGHPDFVFHDGQHEVRIATDPGDYVFIPPYLPHREENPSPDEPATVVIARSTQEAIVVNLPELYAL
jgi:uncharacterized RmlC-like cupin family protein